MTEKYIALTVKDVWLVDIETNGIALAHESAHARQLILPEFSKEWLKQFPVGSDGRVSDYAYKDYTNLKHVANDPINKHVEGIPVFVHQDVNLPTLAFYGDINELEKNILIAAFKANYSSMPIGLQEAMEMIKIDERIDRCYFFHGGKVSTAYNKIAEDVAETTEYTLIAVLKPHCKREFLRKLERNALTRRRIEILADYKFIDRPIAKQLLDPHFRKHYI